MDDNKNLKIQNTKYTLKQSPHYDEQNEEIELLKNIIPDRLTVESDDPNYVLDINVISSSENPEKEYILKIYLNYFYPEKSPRFEFYEKNDFLQENRKKEIISRLKKVLEENLGCTTIYQLYECAVEFADEEEERRAKIMEEYKKQLQVTNYSIGQMKIYKQFDNYLVTDLVILKNNYLILACCEDKFSPHLRIIDDCYEKVIYELDLLNNQSEKKYQFTIKKMVLFNISNNEDNLYLVCSDKIIREYKIHYLKSRNKKTGLNISIELFSSNSGYNFLDLIILNDYNNCFLFFCKEEIVFWKYNDSFQITNESIINSIEQNNCIEIFIFDKNNFILTNQKKNSLIFLNIKDNNLKKYNWGKKIKVRCGKTKNYIVKIDEKNILFWNDGLKEIIIIYIPTYEIVSRYEYYKIVSINKINSSIYLCSTKGITEIDFKKVYLSEYEIKCLKNFNSINLIKPLEKSYLGFASNGAFMICK